MDLTLTAFNCNGLERSLPYVMNLSQKHQVTFVCEHWLQLSELHTINEAVTQEGMCDPYPYRIEKVDLLVELVSSVTVKA